MDIKFQNVNPHPLKEINHSEKSIWKSGFTLEMGQKVMLNASSGKGKTTFTHILSGNRKDFDGNVFFDEIATNDLSLNQWAVYRRDFISFIFQDLKLFPNLSVAENLSLKNQLKSTHNENEIKDFLADLGILDKWDKPCGILSMGQQQRVAIVRALLQPYKWLIMDEPFSHLDIKNTEKCIELIIKRTEELGAGFILTTLGDNHGINYDKTLYL